MPTCVAVDFETSDYNPESACAIGLARIRLPEEAPAADGALSLPLSPAGAIDGSYYSLIRPPRSRVRFTDIHGLTWPMLKDAPTFAELWPDIAGFIGDASFLVAHNAPFDRNVLRACCARAGVPAPTAPFLCTLKGSRRALRLPSHALHAVCAHCGISLNHHHAESDALASAAILLHLRGLGLGLEAMRVKDPQGPLRRSVRW